MLTPPLLINLMRVLTVACLLALATAYLRVSHANGKELENALEGTFATDGNAGKVFVILFYSEEDSAIRAKNDEYREALKDQVLDPNPTLYYTEVNALTSDYRDFSTRIVGVTEEELKRSPSILIIEEGVGDLVHGPEAVARVAAKVKIFKEHSHHR